MSRSRALAAAAALALFACSSAASEPAAAPSIAAYGETTGAPGALSLVSLKDGARPVEVDVWTPPAAAAPAGLVLLSHGSGSKGTLHKYLAEHLSSRGYLVLAPNHYGDTLGTPATDTVYVDRVADLRRVLDESEVRERWRTFLEQGASAVGHSIGGYDALALCGARVDERAISAACEDGDERFCRLADDARVYADPRVATCIGLTPFVHPIYGDAGEGAAAINRPVLLFGATADPILKLEPYLRAFHARAPDTTVMLEIAGAGHLDFTDILHDGSLPHAALKAIVNAYVAAWLDATLHADAHAAALFHPDAVEAGPFAAAVTVRPR